MTDTKHPEALRLAALYDADAWPGGLSLNAWAAASAAELRRLHAENTTLQQGYDAARLEIDHLRGATKMVEPAQPVAWLVYLPSIDTQNVYDSQDDPGYVDDVTNHDDAEVTPLYEMAAPASQDAATRLKDGDIAALVNRLRDIAIEYSDTQQLRERIASEIRPRAAGLVGVASQDAARYRGLRDLAKERLLYPQRAASELAADMRTHWELPVLICSGPIGGYRDFDSAVDRAIDAARAKQEGK